MTKSLLHYALIKLPQFQISDVLSIWDYQNGNVFYAHSKFQVFSTPRVDHQSELKNAKKCKNSKKTALKTQLKWKDPYNLDLELDDISNVSNDVYF